MSNVRTPPNVRVPPEVIVTVVLLATVTFPTVAVAKLSVELALKLALSAAVQAVPPVGEAGLLQLVPVHDPPLVASVLQKRV